MTSSLELLDRTVLKNPWIRAEPTPKQAAFLIDPRLEVLFGGAAGGGKSVSLLMAALQYVDDPGYHALLIRRTYADLALPGALIDMAAEWLSGTAAKYNVQERTWTFPSGATLTFGSLEHVQDRFKYQGTNFSFVGFDELTQHFEVCYRFLFSRLRRPIGATTPLRMRATSNPGGIGSSWVKERFITSSSPNRAFIPAGLADNPHIDRDAYLVSLGQLDPVTRRQLLDGDWSARSEGSYFRREWFEIVPEAPADAKLVRYWDLAGTAAREGRDPDWTAGALLGIKDGIYWLVDMRHMRGRPDAVERLIRQTAELDGRSVPIVVEQEPGSAGKALVDHYRRHVLVGWSVRGDHVTGPKEQRASPLSSAAEAGNVRLVRGPWIPELLDELEAFDGTGQSHDDQVDAMAGALQHLTSGGRSAVVSPGGAGLANPAATPGVVSSVLPPGLSREMLPTSAVAAMRRRTRALPTCPSCGKELTIHNATGQYLCREHGWTESKRR